MDRAANKRSAFSLSFTLALYISDGFELSETWEMVRVETPAECNCCSNDYWEP